MTIMVINIKTNRNHGKQPPTTYKVYYFRKGSIETKNFTEVNDAEMRLNGLNSRFELINLWNQNIVVWNNKKRQKWLNTFFYFI